MYNQDKQAFTKAMSYKNVSPQAGNKPVPEKTNPLKLEFRALDKTGELKRPIPNINQKQESIVSVERLQEAIIWSEILGKPVSKRRKRR